MCANRDFDFVVFGASGFTGQYVVEYVAKIYQEENFRWAIAGRSRKKLQEVLTSVSSITGKDLAAIPIMEADIDNAPALASMCRRSKIVLNCVGPYSLFGEPVVKVCIENGCHHVDISGESLFVESMQLKYHQAAQEAGVYVIGTAGFDSVPCESGIQFLQENFDGEVCTVETLLRVNLGPDKTSANIGTLNSVIHHFSHQRELRELHAKVAPKPVPKNDKPLKSRSLLSYSKEIHNWCTPFPNTDVDVVNRTQYHNYHTQQMKPVEMKSYLVLPVNFIVAFIIAVFLRIFIRFAQMGVGKYLLEKCPSLVTLGIFSKTGPTRKQIEETSFDMYIIGRGQAKASTPDAKTKRRLPEKKMVVKVHGPEPGYAVTPIIMVQIGLLLLQDVDKLPDKGGVYTPGAAFRNTNLIQRLTKNGMTYKVISQ